MLPHYLVNFMSPTQGINDKFLSLEHSAVDVFLIWLLTTAPQLIYVATLPANFFVMACFGDINLSQGSVSTNAACGGTFNTPTLPQNICH